MSTDSIIIEPVDIINESNNNSSLVPTTNDNNNNNNNRSRRLEGVDEIMSSTNEPHNGITGDLHSFRMSYTMIGHQAFLLSLIQLSIIYPNDLICLSCTILSSLWRLIISICNIIYLLNNTNTNSMMSMNNTRYIYSFVFTLLELIAMVPILYAAISLYLDISCLTPRMIINKIIV